MCMETRPQQSATLSGPRFNGGKRGMTEVFFGKGKGDAEVGPAKVKGRVIEAEAAFGGGTVEIVALIGEERVILEDDEAVGEAAGDVELKAVLGSELNGDMPAKCGGVFADVNGHVPDGTADDADEFAEYGGPPASGVRE